MMGLQPLAERRPEEGPPGSFQATLVKVHLGLEVRVEEGGGGGGGGGEGTSEVAVCEPPAIGVQPDEAQGHGIDLQHSKVSYSTSSRSRGHKLHSFGHLLLQPHVQGASGIIPVVACCESTVPGNCTMGDVV